jgi:hypothetical protein
VTEQVRITGTNPQRIIIRDSERTDGNLSCTVNVQWRRWPEVLGHDEELTADVCRVEVALHLEEALFVGLEGDDFFFALGDFLADAEVGDEEAVDAGGDVVDEGDLDGVTLFGDDGAGEPLLHAVGLVVHQGDLAGGREGRKCEGQAKNQGKLLHNCLSLGLIAQIVRPQRRGIKESVALWPGVVYQFPIVTLTPGGYPMGRGRKNTTKKMDQRKGQAKKKAKIKKSIAAGKAARKK